MHSLALKLVFSFIPRKYSNWLNILLVCKEWKNTFLEFINDGNNAFYSNHLRVDPKDATSYWVHFITKGELGNTEIRKLDNYDTFLSRVDLVLGIVNFSKVKIEYVRCCFAGYEYRFNIRFKRKLAIKGYKFIVDELIRLANREYFAWGCNCSLSGDTHLQLDCIWEKYHKEEFPVHVRKGITKRFGKGRILDALGEVCVCDKLGQELCEMCSLLCCPFASVVDRPFLERKSNIEFEYEVWELRIWCYYHINGDPIVRYAFQKSNGQRMPPIINLK